MRDHVRRSRWAVVTIALVCMGGFIALSVWAGDEPPATQPSTQPLEPTPIVEEDDHEPTPRAIEGPYFKRDSPQRTSLIEGGTRGTRLIISGRVLDLSGNPVPKALLDFWQADADGEYDNVGFKLRGHQFSDEAGRYELQTIVPGNYERRTRHIHVKVQAANGPVLTTQLYFPDDPLNNRDRLFDPRLVMKVRDADSERRAAFNFVIRTR